MGQEPSQSRTFRKHREGCVAPLVNAECDCPPEIVYVPSDEAAVERAAKAIREALIEATDVIPHGEEPFVGWSAVLADRLAPLALRAAGGGQ